ncbi:uncharacterized protein [Nicotiana tomentosiformis]|uniref:uncharacterized protein n=1 Tax=Nicotiana tomentosiformis TaxID=4098 RepID=UPI00388C43B7
MGVLAFIPVRERPLALDVHALVNSFMTLDVSKPRWILGCMVSQSSLFKRIKARQYNHPYFLVLKYTVQHGDAKEVTIGNDGLLRLHGRICVPNVDGLCELILEEAHSSQGSWDQIRLLAEFAYNNIYLSSIQMAPYEALYGR